MRASVVLPLPGGPYRIIELTRSSSIASGSAEPLPRMCSWPTKSSSRWGRSRSASGATSGRRWSAASEKRSLIAGKSMLPGVATVSIRDEAAGLLQELIRLDTVNPPGNETRAAEHLRAYLEENGVACELYAKVPERANLVARIPGTGDGPRLLLLSHTDTVLADPREWQLDPWAGELRDDQVWGRGALDMKGQVAASAVAIASLAREGFEPAGDLIFVASADEEVGEDFGLQWLAREHPEAVRAEYAINEGGGDRVVFAGRPLYLCAVAEKMSAPFRLKVHGRSGHASMPGIADNALVKGARIVERLAEYRPELTHTPETEPLVRAVLGELPEPAEALVRLEAVHPLARSLVEPL